MKSLFRLGFTLALVISVCPAIAAASRCTSEQMQKMAHGDLLQQEITLICDTASALSQEEATEKLKAYAVKNSGLEVWYWIELPKPGNIALHDLNWH